MGIDAVTTIAQAISDGFKLLKTVLDTAETRRMRACVDAGESYIFTNEDTKISEAERKKLLTHYRKRFFSYN